MERNMNWNPLHDDDEKEKRKENKDTIVNRGKIYSIMIVLLVLLILFGKSCETESSGTKTSSSSSSSSSSAATSNSNSSDSQWQKAFFIDEFNDYTDKSYITLKKIQTGTFSNSATTDSLLKWNIIITKEYVGFLLYEYGNSQVKGFKSYPDTYQISIKDSSGKITTLNAYNNSDRVMTKTDNDFKRFIEILKVGRPVKIVIKETGSAASSSYNLGSLDCHGMWKAYNSLDSK